MYVCGGPLDDARGSGGCVGRVANSSLCRANSQLRRASSQLCRDDDSVAGLRKCTSEMEMGSVSVGESEGGASASRMASLCASEMAPLCASESAPAGW